MEFNALPSSTTDTNTYFVITKIVSGVPNDYKIPISDLSAYLGTGNIVGEVNLLAQTTALASVISYTPPLIKTFQISTYCNVTASSGGTLAINVSFTDENNVAHTLAINNYSSTGFFQNGVVNIRAKASTVISVVTTLTGTATYDVGAVIIQI